MIRSYDHSSIPGRKSRRALGALVVVLASFGVVATPALADGSNGGAYATPTWVNGFWHHQGANGENDVNVCSYAVAPGSVHCNAQVVTDLGSNALAAAPVQPSPTGCTSSDTNVPSSVSASGTGAYDPCYLDSAYNVAAAAAAHGGGAGQIVAIVDAYSDPNVTSNLASYRSFFNLSACPTGTVSSTTKTCTFEVVNQNGATSPLPTGNSGWGEEISLDVEMVSAICPNCQILLVEASSATMASLGTGVNTAVAMGANVVSNSYGGSEYSSEVNDSLSYFNHPGVAIVVASGDSGFGTEFPAASPFVTAVGGTSLYQSSDGGTRNASESVWSGAGAGCSSYESKPTWQSDTGCPRRMVTDVSAVADPNTGVWVYDTYGTGFTWGAFGGTSVATPIISSMYALAGNSPGGQGVPASSLYANQSSLYPVTTGNDGSCPSSPQYFCNAAASVNGYNGPTGLGTPGGSPSSIAAFSTVSTPPTAPGAPNLTSATPSSGAVSLTWSAPSSNGGSPITGYDVYFSTSPTPIPAGSPTFVTGTSDTVTGLANGTKYYFEVEAVNSVGNSNSSNQLSATPVANSAPSAPTLNSATPGNTSVALQWSAPSSNGGSPITGYDVYDSTSPTPIPSGSPTFVPGTGTSYTVTGLTNGSTYYFEVEAVNGVGNSTSSNQIPATPVASAVPGAPSLNSAQPGRRQITLSYTAPSNNGGSAITGYYIYIGTSAGGESTTPINSTPINYTRVTVTGLTRGTTYYFVVRAVNKNGTGAASNELSATSR